MNRRRIPLPRLKRRDKPRRRNWLNYIIGIVLSLAVVATGLLLYVNRYGPAAVEPAVSSPRPTHTAMATRTTATVPPTRTPRATPVRQVTPTSLPSSTPTPPPTSTPTPTPSATSTPTRPPATATPGPPRPSATPGSGWFPYTVEGPRYQPNLIANYAGCEWLGLAGQVFGPSGEPQTGLLVHIWGGGIDEVVYSGHAEAYGPSGWERSLDDHPKEGLFFVQLHDGTQPLSPVVEVGTTDDCHRNLVIVNFHQR